MTKVKSSKSRKVFVTVNTVLLVVFSLVFLYPYVMILISSVTAETALAKNGAGIFPEAWSLEAYRFLGKIDFPILRSFWNSVWVTAVSTVLTTLVCTLYSFAVAHPKLKGVKFFNIFVVITMLFGGGLVPYYIVVSSLFNDSLWAIIIPGCMAAWYTFLIRNYFYTLPGELREAAEMDGAGVWKVLFQVYFPLAKPVMATIALFAAVSQWNSFTGPLLFLTEKENYTIQLAINTLNTNISSITSSSSGIVPVQGVKMATVVIATLPIICMYPFLQKYFINGMVVGGVKE